VRRGHLPLGLAGGDIERSGHGERSGPRAWRASMPGTALSHAPRRCCPLCTVGWPSFCVQGCPRLHTRHGQRLASLQTTRVSHRAICSPARRLHLPLNARVLECTRPASPQRWMVLSHFEAASAPQLTPFSSPSCSGGSARRRRRRRQRKAGIQHRPTLTSSACRLRDTTRYGSTREGVVRTTFRVLLVGGLSRHTAG
jgi:hypothetical protein